MWDKHGFRCQNLGIPSNPIGGMTNDGDVRYRIEGTS